jgi:hypothetical protein
MFDEANLLDGFSRLNGFICWWGATHTPHIDSRYVPIFTNNEVLNENASSLKKSITFERNVRLIV